MQGRATIGGHPIHPMLIPFPIAFFVGALISDIISHWGDPVFWPRMSVALIGMGIVGALVAALFGFTDYLTAPMTAEAKKTATSHMILNLLVVAVFSVALYIRLDNATATSGYVFTVIGVLLLSASGYLGGKLAYQFGIGVDDRRGSGAPQ